MLPTAPSPIGIRPSPERVGRVLAPTTGELLVFAVVLAAGSLVVDRTVRFDAIGWLRWGQELTGGGGFDTSALPSWKPLPLIAPAPLAAVLGPAAAKLAWLALVRIAALGALVLVARRATPAAAVLLALGYPLPPRFFLPAAAAAAPLIGLGLTTAITRTRPGTTTTP